MFCSVVRRSRSPWANMQRAPYWQRPVVSKFLHTRVLKRSAMIGMGCAPGAASPAGLPLASSALPEPSSCDEEPEPELVCVRVWLEFAFPLSPALGESDGRVTFVAVAAAVGDDAAVLLSLLLLVVLVSRRGWASLPGMEHQVSLSATPKALAELLVVCVVSATKAVGTMRSGAGVVMAVRV